MPSACRAPGAKKNGPESLCERPGPFDIEAGDDVLSHSVSRAVPSARRGLTTVFGMGTGVALAPLPPARVGGPCAGGECPVALSVRL